MKLKHVCIYVAIVATLTYWFGYYMGNTYPAQKNGQFGYPEARLIHDDEIFYIWLEPEREYRKCRFEMMPMASTTCWPSDL